MEQMIDNSTKAFTSLFWFQEQGEKFIQTCLEQSKIGRDQAAKMAEKITEQARDNQKLLQEMVQTTVKANLEAYKIVSQQSIEQMQKQVDLLSKQVELLNSKTAR